MSEETLEPRDDPNVMRFHRYRPLSEMVDDMVKDTGITHEEGMSFLTQMLGIAIKSVREDE